MAIKLKRFDAINVVPFIDIMLVLLAIVLTMATFVAQGVIPVELPKASTSTQPPAIFKEITIRPDGTLALDSHNVTPEVLSQAIASGDPTTTVIIRTDKATPFEHFVTVMDMLKANHYEKLSIVTKTIQ